MDYFLKWMEYEGIITFVAVGENNPTDKPWLIIPFSPTSLHLYEVGKRLGYDVISPRCEQFVDDSNAALREFYGAECSVGFIDQITVQGTDGQRLTARQEPLSNCEFRPTELHIFDDNHERVLLESIVLSISVTAAEHDERMELTESVDVLLTKNNNDLSWYFVDGKDGLDSAISVIAGMVREMRPFWWLPDNYESEEREFIDRAEDARFALQLEKDIHGELGPMGISAVLDAFDINNESIKRYSAALE